MAFDQAVAVQLKRLNSKSRTKAVKAAATLDKLLSRMASALPKRSWRRVGQRLSPRCWQRGAVQATLVMKS
jgi:hypothetical protein